MALFAECPFCHRKQKTKNKKVLKDGKKEGKEVLETPESE